MANFVLKNAADLNIFLSHVKYVRKMNIFLVVAALFFS